MKWKMDKKTIPNNIGSATTSCDHPEISLIDKHITHREIDSYR
jgi:hypothetical protein